MPCYKPLQGWKSREVTNSGRRKIVFNIQYGYADLPVTVPCGQCIGCKLDKSRQWAIRCVHEAKQNVCNCFLTLTYAPENLPENGTLVKEHFQKFMKRLRKEIDKNEPGKKIRFFACGEYGECGNRPHYHAIVFGHDFNDKEYIGMSNGHKLYTSNQLSSIWGLGICSIGQVTFDSAAYVARYTTKKITGERAEQHYNGKLPEFALMSTSGKAGGIGKQWFQRNYQDYERAGNRIILDNGISCKPARYYEKIYDSIIGDYNGYKGGRKALAKTVTMQKESSPERLQVKERLQEYSLRQQKLNKGAL